MTVREPFSALLNRAYWRWHRISGGWRCAVFLHRLKQFRDCGDGVNIQPLPLNGNPGPHEWRVCTWCGARWESGYDPLYGRGLWVRKSGPLPVPSAISRAANSQERPA